MTQLCAQILLSTYNGEAFLMRQIESIRSQSEGNWALLIRDDGSSDSTCEIILKYCALDSRIVHFLDTRGQLGPTQSFAALLGAARCDVPLFFCDQDDEWHPEKLSEFLKVFDTRFASSPTTPHLVVHSDLSIIDSTGSSMAPSFHNLMGFIGRDHELPHLIGQNTTPGCSMAISAGFKNLILPIPVSAQMHDWWIMLLGSAIGHIRYIPQALTAYRQHNTQASGGSGEGSLLKKLRRALSNRSLSLGVLTYKRMAQAVALSQHLDHLKIYSPQSADLKKWLFSMQGKSASECFQQCFNYGLRMQGLLRNILFFFALLRHNTQVQKALIVLKRSAPN